LDDPLTKAQHYRNQAIHIRELAGKDDNPDTHKALIALADNYQRLYEKFPILAASGRLPEP
jgi:hypothetical protein